MVSDTITTTSGPQRCRVGTSKSRNTTNIKHLQSGSVCGVRNHTGREEGQRSVRPGVLLHSSSMLSFHSLFLRITACAQRCVRVQSGSGFLFKSDLNPESLRRVFLEVGWRSLVELQSPDLLRPPGPALHLLLGS